MNNNTVIQIQKLKKVLRIFPYKFKNDNGEFKSYLDQPYLETHLQYLLDDINVGNICQTERQFITIKFHFEEGINVLLYTENHAEPVYGDTYICQSNNTYTYLMLNVAGKSSKEMCDVDLYVVPKEQLSVDNLLKLLNKEFYGAVKLNSRKFTYMETKLTNM